MPIELLGEDFFKNFIGYSVSGFSDFFRCRLKILIGFTFFG
jgi:hypothetical protein